MKCLVSILALGIAGWAWLQRQEYSAAGCPVSLPLLIDQEDTTPDGTSYTPATQSFLRGHHMLEQATEVQLCLSTDDIAEFHFAIPPEADEEQHHFFSLHHVPLRLLSPRLHYKPATPPDAFDAFNLMMAEFSRNGISIPVGTPDDDMCHFETSFDDSSPWTLVGDYRFVPRPSFRPLRVSLANNCLGPGLWEIAATDRAGELYHGWTTLPDDIYYAVAARANGLDKAFVQKALSWRNEPVPLRLDRLRRADSSYGRVTVRMIDGPAGFSSPGSRRKLQKGYAKAEANGALVDVRRLSDFIRYPVHMSAFVAPGKYSSSHRQRFDLAFLQTITAAVVSSVTPLTCYNGSKDQAQRPPSDDLYIDIVLEGDGMTIILGNLPFRLLVPQEDYVLHGFGVGILAAADYAERRNLLIEKGHAPSYAYVSRSIDGVDHALNSHLTGLEQIYIRALPFARTPHWQITLTSFERIVDVAKFEIDIPESLIKPARHAAADYVSPIYFTYRDDNLR